MGGGQYNKFHHNNFISNNGGEVQALDFSEGFGTDFWYSQIEEEGNYWSDYNGPDTNGNGIGDIPYDIDGEESQDLYPLMDPWVGATIFGLVTDDVLDPIEGVYVYGENTSRYDTTDINGEYSLLGLCPGMYDVSFTHPDYCDTTVTGITVTVGDTTFLNVMMQLLGSISGAVTDEASDPIEGIHVSVVNASTDDTTDINGEYSLTGLCPGIYDISFTHPDYRDTTVVGVTVTAGDTTILNIVQYSVEIEENNPDVTLPKAFSLSQNHPNPFNPITEIKYAPPVDCQVKLEIYNTIGQKVTTLVNEKQKAGYKIVRWDSRSQTGIEVSSGLYFYRLQVGEFVETRKMILLR